MKNIGKFDCKDLKNPARVSSTLNRTTYMLTLKTQPRKANQYQTSFCLFHVAPGKKAEQKMEELPMN
jgi:hypothetical protein